MKTNIVRLFWGILLIALGGLFLADRLGYVDLQLITQHGWWIIFAGLSIIFFLCYFVSGVRNWGWLFPALIFAALALVLSSLIDNAGALIAMLVLLSIAIPFFIGYIFNRRHWGLLIPAYILTIISIIIVLAENTNSDLIGAAILYSIALPFFTVYLVNRQHKWALIVGSVLAFIGLFPLLEPILPEEYAGPVIMFLFAVFFLAIYFISRKLWWSIIPAGVFSSIGVVALLETLLPEHEYFMVEGLQFGGYTGVLLLGFALTFGVLWLLRSSQPTAWAKYPAIGLLILSLLAFLLWRTASDLVLAVFLLAVGAVMVFSSILKRRGSQELSSGHS